MPGVRLQRLLAFAGEVARASLLFVARLGVTGHLDAAQQQRLLERLRGELRRIFDGHRNVQSGGGRRAPGAHQRGAGTPLQARDALPAPASTGVMRLSIV